MLKQLSGRMLRGRGDIKLVVSDGAGTLFDARSMGPVHAMRRVCKAQGFRVTESEIRQFMGLPKALHWHKLFTTSLHSQFYTYHGRAFDDALDLPILLAAYEASQLDVLDEFPECTQLVGGALELVDHFRSRGTQIALTTGYNRLVLNKILESLNTQGFVPDITCSASEARTRKQMIESCFSGLEISHNQTIAVGDTINDTKGARFAHVVSVGIKNEFTSESQFQEAGADFCVDTLLDVNRVVAHCEEK
jgi:phosphoglycolate phosphatase-like HAD superfamily hydrolase